MKDLFDELIVDKIIKCAYCDKPLYSIKNKKKKDIFLKDYIYDGSNKKFFCNGMYCRKNYDLFLRGLKMISTRLENLENNLIENEEEFNFSNKCHHNNCKKGAVIKIKIDKDILEYCLECGTNYLLHRKRKKHYNCIKNKAGCYCKCNIKPRKKKK